jgi:hypothetical protein
MKPEKVREEFDCTAKHNVTSLNDHLLQGPDLTNSSFALLRVRFREKPVVLVAMFSQITVDPKECDALRFLWWGRANLKAIPTENRMVKHVFRVSPTIFARNYGTAAVISYNLKRIAPPVPSVQCWIDKNLMSGCEAPTLKRVGGGRVGKMYQ